jgi:hypothetical protein
MRRLTNSLSVLEEGLLSEKNEILLFGGSAFI